MKKILLASVALLGFTAAASAADLPSRRVAPVVAAVPVFTWTGFYAGVNAGFGFNSNDSIVLSNGVVVDSIDGDDDAGFIGGAQIGFNYQMGSFVVGVEGDLQYADFGDARYTIPGVVGTWEGESDDWFGTARARAGVAFDRALIYATGGFAFADDRTGWVVGGGLEYAFTNNLTAKIEGLYVNLEDQNYTVNNVTFSSEEQEFGVIRAGLNYKFSSY
ncbi:porin family protein [Microvirga sp. ACRRW]|uniref:outer membrane protein n=1 Tax=Microvirga sp. ACRRW TaxID=2918205 RepID=UPI001EF3F4A2|nr:outer membrane protein [Microvirga sp. ACRRW]MCG7394192.1 porin family protein [Microvirga sp. ACRRW]